MDRERHISSLQKSAATERKSTAFCPDDHQIAAFVDGALDDSSRVLIERHLPDCPACVARVGQLMRLMRDEASAESAESKVPNKNRLAVLRQWAVAATFVLAIVWATWLPDRVEDSDVRNARNIESALVTPEILAPDSGVLASREGFVIRWTAVPGSVYYKVRIVSDVGDLLSEARVENTEWAIGNEIALEPGSEYFIRVDAYLSDSKRLSSQHIPFRLRD